MGGNFSHLNLKLGLFSPFLLSLPHPSGLFLTLSLSLEGLQTHLPEPGLME